MHPHPTGPHPRTPTTRTVTSRALVVVVLVLALAAAACANTSSRALIGTTTTSEGTTTTTAPAKIPALAPPEGFVVPDTRNATLRPVVGKVRAAPIPVRGGTSSVSGTVTGPDGGVGGATVLIERFVGVQSGSILVAADGAGRFSAPGLLGGRYRVRAWLQPSLAAVQSATGFVADGDNLNLPVTVERHDAITLRVASAVGTLTVGVPAGVNALITQQSVDSNGIVQDTPMAGVSLLLVGSAGLGIEPPNPAVTSASGRVSWSVVCSSPGTYVVSVSSSTPPAAAGATLPECTVATTPSSSTTTTNPTSTTTPPRKGPGR
ncbi:MAG: carboxypeptidase-like regulatory domain-containing protein [Acidimicrobiales bacterium]